MSWRQNKQGKGKGKSKVKQELSLNLLGQPFQENSCLVCTVEAAEGSWKLWEAFHKLGLRQRTLRQTCLMVVMFNGRPTESESSLDAVLAEGQHDVFIYAVTHKCSKYCGGS